MSDFELKDTGKDNAGTETFTVTFGGFDGFKLSDDIFKGMCVQDVFSPRIYTLNQGNVCYRIINETLYFSNIHRAADKIGVLNGTKKDKLMIYPFYTDQPKKKCPCLFDQDPDVLFFTQYYSTDNVSLALELESAKAKKKEEPAAESNVKLVIFACTNANSSQKKVINNHYKNAVRLFLDSKKKFDTLSVRMVVDYFFHHFDFEWFQDIPSHHEAIESLWKDAIGNAETYIVKPAPLYNLDLLTEVGCYSFDVRPRTVDAFDSAQAGNIDYIRSYLGSIVTLYSDSWVIKGAKNYSFKSDSGETIKKKDDFTVRTPYFMDTNTSSAITSFYFIFPKLRSSGDYKKEAEYTKRSTADIAEAFDLAKKSYKNIYLKDPTTTSAATDGFAWNKINVPDTKELENIKDVLKKLNSNLSIVTDEKKSEADKKKPIKALLADISSVEKMSLPQHILEPVNNLKKALESRDNATTKNVEELKGIKSKIQGLFYDCVTLFVYNHNTPYIIMYFNKVNPVIKTSAHGKATPEIMADLLNNNANYIEDSYSWYDENATLWKFGNEKNVRGFLQTYGFGVDCSGFVSRVIIYLIDQLLEKGDYKNYSTTTNKLRERLLTDVFADAKGSSNTSVLAYNYWKVPSSDHAEKIPFSEIIPGDFVYIKRGTSGTGSFHIKICTDVKHQTDEDGKEWIIATFHESGSWAEVSSPGNSGVNCIKVKQEKATMIGPLGSKKDDNTFYKFKSSGNFSPWDVVYWNVEEELAYFEDLSEPLYGDAKGVFMLDSLNQSPYYGPVRTAAIKEWLNNNGKFEDKPPITKPTEKESKKK